MVLTNKAGGTDEALRLLRAALALDPGLLPAHGYAAWLHEQRYFRDGLNPADRAAALAHAEVVLGVNAGDPQAMSIGAFVRGMLTGDYDAALVVFDRALGINANSALVYGFSALAAAHSGRDERAVAHARKSLRLSPLDDPLSYHPYLRTGGSRAICRALRGGGDLRAADDPREPSIQRALRLPGRGSCQPRRARRRGGCDAPAPRSGAGVHRRGVRSDGPLPAGAVASAGGGDGAGGGGATTF